MAKNYPQDSDSQPLWCLVEVPQNRLSLPRSVKASTIKIILKWRTFGILLPRRHMTKRIYHKRIRPPHWGKLCSVACSSFTINCIIHYWCPVCSLSFTEMAHVLLSRSTIYRMAEFISRLIIRSYNLGH